MFFLIFENGNSNTIILVRFYYFVERNCLKINKSIIILKANHVACLVLTYSLNFFPSVFLGSNV